MSASRRLGQLRQLLAEAKLTAYVIPTADAHQSEYVSDFDKRRSWISGFTGSAGTALVTTLPDSEDSALLWTDGRYFNQASKQLVPPWRLMKEGLKETASIEEWLVRKLKPQDRVGIDPMVTPISKWLRLGQEFKDKGLELVAVQQNLVDILWEKEGERPPAPSAPVMVLDIKYTGQNVADKVALLVEALKKEGAGALVLTALDDIAWVTNLRGADISFNPVFLSYACVTAEGQLTLYVDLKKLGPAVKMHLEEANVSVKPYLSVFDDLKQIASDGTKRVWMDPDQCNVALYQSVPAAQVLQKPSPVVLMKAIKNQTELNGMRNCHIRDAAALVQYLSWLETRLEDSDNKEQLTEYTAADVLERYRAMQSDFVALSFETISSVGPNAAVIHYKPEKDTSLPLSKDHIYLCDSGGQYKDGTTDITRTMHFGKPTSHEQACFTRVLKGHIALARAVFPAGTTGPQLDVLARVPLWASGLDYRHGTGHGVGAFLNVHEGPHGISSTIRKNSVATTALVPGMVVTNEPGYYEDGKFGIRIENVMAVVPAVTPHSFEGTKFYAFETISVVPIQKKLLDFSLLSPDDIKWLNEYHAKCWQLVSVELETAMRNQPKRKSELSRAVDWLRDATSPIPQTH